MKTILLLVAILFSTQHIVKAQDDYLEKASSYYDKKDYPNALKHVNLALKIDSVNNKGLLIKGNILAEAGEYKAAFETYTFLISKYPKDGIALNQRGLLLNKLRESEYAIKDFDRAISLGIDSLRLSLLLNRGVAKNDIRDFQGAYDDYISAFKIDSTEIGVLNNLATVCDEVGKGDQTLGYLYRIIAIDSTDIGACHNIAFKHSQKGDYKTAIHFFNKMLSLAPNDPLGLGNRGFCKLKLGDLDGAMYDLDKSLNLYPANSYSYRTRALIFLEQKQPEKACKDIEKALELGFTKMYGPEVEEMRSKNCLKVKG